MNANVTLQQAIQHRKDIVTEIYGMQDRSDNTLNLQVLFHYLRGRDA